MAKPEIRDAAIVDVTFGKGVEVVQPVNLYGCTIGDGSFVGPFVEIQKGVKIGKRCRIQSHSFICELVTIGDDCFISHGAMFINDVFVAGGPAEKSQLWRPTKLGNRVSVGTNATDPAGEDLRSSSHRSRRSCYQRYRRARHLRRQSGPSPPSPSSHAVASA